MILLTMTFIQTVEKILVSRMQFLKLEFGQDKGLYKDNAIFYPACRQQSFVRATS